MTYAQLAGLSVSEDLARFLRDEALPGTGIKEALFWSGAASLFAQFTPAIRDALDERRVLQDALDDYHNDHRGVGVSIEEYAAFLRSIGYLEEEPPPFTITTDGVDPEIALQAGPQLVVPVLNARFAVNAANARWGSLYDALYGTDAVPDEGLLGRTSTYNPVRGREVMARGRAFLDRNFPLAGGSHSSAIAYAVDAANGLVVRTSHGQLGLREPDQLIGFRGLASDPERLLLIHHGLHVEIVVDRADPVGASDPAGVRDIELESAVTAIMDFEDSVAAVDSSDKVLGYRNWLGLVRGTLTAQVTKDGRTFIRAMNPDRVYTTLAGKPLEISGTSLLLVRHVGHHMYSDAVLDPTGSPVPEGILDALITGLCGVHDVRGNRPKKNSRAGAVYVVKPKLHGPAEVALACEVLAEVERVVGLPERSIKVGLMDEERRTSANLRACIAAARDRVAFINTGFLDRTGDEIRTSTHAGPMVPKSQMKAQAWIEAYEDQNVAIGLGCGFHGRAQIGKGMWAAPDAMAQMLREKIAHPRSGASCAWVPSPTAATLHALHYHEVDVYERQRQLATEPSQASLSQLLTLPLGNPAEWTREQRMAEVDGNVQSILGYVVRWVDQGVGCSKVPDLGGTPLMEDRATCRISSQAMANWLLHEIVSVEDVEDSMQRMAVIVDGQNCHDPAYKPLASHYDSPAFVAARNLLLHGLEQPSGYTETVLHRERRARKSDDRENRE